jgi:hypothetical protein
LPISERPEPGDVYGAVRVSTGQKVILRDNRDSACCGSEIY